MDIAKAISRYGLYLGLGLIVVVFVRQFYVASRRRGVSRLDLGAQRARPRRPAAARSAASSAVSAAPGRVGRLRAAERAERADERVRLDQRLRRAPGSR